MAITTVLFDLDGTLLPMDQEQFIQGYCRLLAEKMAPHGYDPRQLIDVIWAGTGAMVKNDGGQTNEAVFWRVFAQRFGERALDDRPLFEDFYRTGFQKARAFCRPTPLAARVVDAFHRAGCRVVLATNPIFPRIATESRMAWAGLSPRDFAWYTTYETSRFCKPNPAYYRELAERLALVPEECLMVGNDANEDMAAQALGMRVFLLTDCLINQKRRDISVYPRGSFPQLMAFAAGQVAGLPKGLEE